MHPIEFPEQNAVLAKDQPEYLPLPVCRHGDRTISCWKLTFGERLKLLFTGRLWLLVLNVGGPLQPQLPMVESPFVQLKKTRTLMARLRERLDCRLARRGK
jgi:hypothetical protein